MELLVLNEKLEAVWNLDAFDSLIWTDRFDECGDFELYTGFTPDILENVQQGYFLQLAGSRHLMMVEGRQIASKVDTGNKIIITGRSIDAIIDFRIVWNQTELSGNFQDELQRLFNENAINPSDPDRKLPYLTFKHSNDSRITALTIEKQFTGDSLYTVVKDACQSMGIGYQILLTENNTFEFELLCGTDRSYDQTDNAPVVFSPSFENLVNSDYVEKLQQSANVAHIGGEGDGPDRVWVTRGSYSGLNRREMYVDAKDLTSTVNQVKLTPTQYNAALQQRGAEKLAEKTEYVNFSGEADTTTGFVYGVDFYMGDIVQIINEYGIMGASQMTELVFFQNDTKNSVTPTFKAI